MANYNSLKATVNANIKANNNQEITGPILNSVLTQMINSLGAGYQYMGIALPSSNPGTPDQRLFYLAYTSGTYTNFGNIAVYEGELAILKYSGSWSKDVMGAVTNEGLAIVTNFEKLNGWISATSITRSGESSYYAIKVNGGEDLKITASAIANTNIAFVKSLVRNENQVLDFATGYTSRVAISRNTTSQFTVPTDCRYILVNDKYTYSGSSDLPVSLIIGDYDYIAGILGNIKNIYETIASWSGVVEDLRGLIRTNSSIIAPASDISTLQGWVGGNNSIDYDNPERKLFVIPVTGGETLYIKANAANAANIVFAADFDYNARSLSYSARYPSRITIRVSSERQFFVPEDCKYIIVNHTYNASSVAVPQILRINGLDFAEDLRTNLLDKLNSTDLSRVVYPVDLWEAVGRPDASSTTFPSGGGYSTFTFKVKTGCRLKIYVESVEAVAARFVFSSAIPSVGGNYNFLGIVNIAANSTGSLDYTARADGYLSVNCWTANCKAVYAEVLSAENSANIAEMHNIDLVSAIRKGHGATRADRQMDSMLSIVHITDSHNDWPRVKRAFNVAKTLGLTLCHTGDFVVGSYDNIAELLTYTEDAQVRYLHCVGNHDVWSMGLNSEAYDKYIAPFYSRSYCGWQLPSGVTYPTFYYFDDATYKVRYIAIDQWRQINEPHAHYAVTWSQEQINFIINSLMNTPSGYGIIILQHSPEGSVVKSEGLDKFYQENEVVTEFAFEPVKKIVDAFIGGTSVNTTVETPREVLTISANFANVASNEFIAYLTGHMHRDLVSYATNTVHRQLVLNETCTICKIANDGDTYAEVGDLGRDLDSASQDAFNVYAIDRVNHVIRIARVGSDMPYTLDIRRDCTEIPYV